MPREVRRRLGRLISAFAVAAIGAVGLAPSASADVYISPSEGVQGSATRITFHVHNHRAGVYTTRLQVDLPAAAPVAEVFPMTVPDWAPKILFRPVDRPLPGIHGSELTEATSSVIWTRAADAPPAAGTEELYLEMGPLPAVPEYAFSVTQTSSDGTVQRWDGGSGSSGTGRGRGTVLTLLPATDGAAGGAPVPGHAAGHAPNRGGDPDAAAESTQLAAQATAGQVNDSRLSLRRVAGVLMLALVLGLLLVQAGRRRRARDPLSDKAVDDKAVDGRALGPESDVARTPSVAPAHPWHP